MMMTTLILYIILYYYIKYYNIYVYKYIFYLSYTDDIQMIEDIDSGMYTGMKNDMNKVPKQLPERSHASRPTSIRPDFSVPGYRMLDSKSSNEKPATNPVQSRASSFKPQGRPLQVRSDFSVPGYRMLNSKGTIDKPTTITT